MRAQIAEKRRQDAICESKRIHALYLSDFYKQLKRHVDVLPFVQIESVGDDSVCEYCRKYAGQAFHYRKAPRLPHKKCSNPNGCKCIPIMIMEEDAVRMNLIKGAAK
jgi:hypothetical protein